MPIGLCQSRQIRIWVATKLLSEWQGAGCQHKLDTVAYWIISCRWFSTLCAPKVWCFHSRLIPNGWFMMTRILHTVWLAVGFHSWEDTLAYVHSYRFISNMCAYMSICVCVCVSSVFKNSLYIYMCVHINYLWYAFVLPWEKLTKAPSRKGLGLIQNLCEQQHLRCRLTHGRNPRFSVFQHPWIYIGFIIVSIYCFRIPWSETLFLFNVRNHEKSIKQYSKL